MSSIIMARPNAPLSRLPGYVTVDHRSSALPPIGRPIADTEIVILDQEGKPARPGEVGEIYVGGAGVGRGYRHRPQQTKSDLTGSLPQMAVR